MLITVAEFVLEGEQLDFAKVTQVVGVSPTVVYSRGEVCDGGPVEVDRWVLVGRTEPIQQVSPVSFHYAMDYLGPLHDLLVVSVDSIATYCRINGVTASFRVWSDSSPDDFPYVELPPDFCAFLARLGADVSFDMGTLIDEDDVPELAPEVIAEGLRKFAEIGPLGGIGSPRGSALVLAGRVVTGPRESSAVFDSIEALAVRQATLEMGAFAWSMAQRRGGAHVLLGERDSRFRFVDADAGPYVAVAVAENRPGLDVQVAGRVFSPGLLERLAPAERAYILGSDMGAASALTTGGAPWPVLSAVANARSLEVWAKKQAYLMWRGEWAQEGLGSFNVMDPAGLGVRFLPFDFAEASDLIGWLCLDYEPVQAMEAVWVEDLSAADGPDVLEGALSDADPSEDDQGEVSLQTGHSGATTTAGRSEGSPDPGNGNRRMTVTKVILTVDGDVMDFAEFERLTGLTATYTSVGHIRHHWPISRDYWSFDTGDVDGDFMERLSRFQECLDGPADLIREYCEAHGLARIIYFIVESTYGPLSRVVVPSGFAALAGRLDAGIDFDCYVWPRNYP